MTTLGLVIEIGWRALAGVFIFCLALVATFKVTDPHEIMKLQAEAKLEELLQQREREIRK